MRGWAREYECVAVFQGGRGCTTNSTPGRSRLHNRLKPATLWHGNLSKEPSPTGSCLSDLIGLCKPKHKTPPPNTQREGKPECRHKRKQPPNCQGSCDRSEVFHSGTTGFKPGHTLSLSQDPAAKWSSEPHGAARLVRGNGGHI